jgi:GntR family transcriptional repressor for pyruvate dehydrogenase complex
LKISLGGYNQLQIGRTTEIIPLVFIFMATTPSYPLAQSTALGMPSKVRRGTERNFAGTSSLQPLGSPNRVTAVVEQLTQAVLSGEMETGSLLPPERDLAEHLGVSRNVVREATKILQSRGLLSIKQGLGTIVSGVTSEPMQRVFSDTLHGHDKGAALLHLTEVRLSLEVKIAELAALRATSQNIDTLRGLIAQLDESLEDVERYATLDVAFHYELALSTQNPLFGVMLESAATLLHESRARALMKETPARSQRSHRAIFAAVEARDDRRAAQEMLSHLEMQKDAFEQQFSRS